MNSVNQYIKDYDRLVERFCYIDDFTQGFDLDYQQTLLADGLTRRLRLPSLSSSEIMTILIEFHYSRFIDFKAFYKEYVLVHLKDLFPQLVSYNRFVELMPRVLVHLVWFSQAILAPCTGISFVDSTVLKVCHNKRIFNHKVFKGIAKKGRSTMGWFFGFKLHLVVSDEGDILSFCLSPGNVDDRKPLPYLSQNLFGKLFGDKGYISAKKFTQLFNQGVRVVTGIRRNMKNKLMELMDKIYLRKRSIIETVNDWLKNVCHIEHSRHRSPANFLVNFYSALIAYQLSPKKPKINFTNSQLRLIPAVC